MLHSRHLSLCVYLIRIHSTTDLSGTQGKGGKKVRNQITGEVVSHYHWYEITEIWKKKTEM